MNDMKNKKLVTIIVVLMVIIILGVGYITISVINTHNNDKNSEKEISQNIEEDAKRLYEEVVKPIFIAGINNGKASSFSLEDISVVVAAVAKDSDYLQNVCGTELEKKLIKDEIIAAKGEGQFDCENHYLMSIQNFKKIANNILGRDINISIKPEEGFQYHEKHQLIRTFIMGDIQIKYDSYEVKGDVLTIKVITGDDQESSVKFRISGNNYYLYEVIGVKQTES